MLLQLEGLGWVMENLPRPYKYSGKGSFKMDIRRPLGRGMDSGESLIKE